MIMESLPATREPSSPCFQALCQALTPRLMAMQHPSQPGSLGGEAASAASTSPSQGPFTPAVRGEAAASRPGSEQELLLRRGEAAVSRPGSVDAALPTQQSATPRALPTGRASAPPQTTAVPKRHLQFFDRGGSPAASTAAHSDSSLSSPGPLPSALCPSSPQGQQRSAATDDQGHRPAAQALLEAQAGVAEAEAAVQQARRQRHELWQLVDRLMATERGRAREAEGQLWEARYQVLMAAQQFTIAPQ